MSLDWTRFFNLIGMFSVFVVLIVMALLSKRLGIVTRARPYYLGFYVAALLIGVSILVRLLSSPVDADLTLQPDAITIIIYSVFPAVSLTLAVVIAWRYWSWLFAERN